MLKNVAGTLQVPPLRSVRDGAAAYTAPDGGGVVVYPAFPFPGYRDYV